ncbi:carbohydrate ABC transporter permease [Paenibacillus xylanexedens]|uniref:carbohydrate ABC transporter permease n=1 Tax=Paenibacillus xylanexedens TaxID=528191 RepID=UPI0011A8A192|nr:carbohydrate ABC transporter permease [Paenibacillus xylanexedens]
MRWLRVFTHLGMGTLSLLWLYPIIWMISASVQPEGAFFTGNIWPSKLDFSGYERAWNAGQFNRYFFNSFVITTSVILITLFVTSLSGYVIGRYPFKGKKIVVAVLVASVFIPVESSVITVFQLIKDMGLLNSLAGIILVEAGSGNIMFILLFAGYFRKMPKELQEAAIMDGSGFFRTFVSIILPLAKPVIVTVTVMQFIWSWNSFLMPLVLTLSKPELRTLAVGLYALKGENVVDWTGIAAGATISLVPVMLIFLFLQRYFVNGLAGSIKG